MPPRWPYTDKMIVIADDLTGAAEIAGVSWRKGYSVQLTMEVPRELPECEVLVIATDCRQQSQEEAVAVVKDIAEHIAPQSGHIFFKKIDSALRGHIVEETTALMKALGKEKAMVIAQNPTKGRIIRNGIYYINHIPLDRSQFSDDPEFPALTSVMEERFHGIHVLSLNSPLPKGVSIADASTMEEINRQLEKADHNTLLAGAADMFSLVLDKVGGNSIPTNATQLERQRIEAKELLPEGQPILLIQGSTQSKRNTFGITECLMPDDVFQGSPAKTWIKLLHQQYKKERRIAIRIPQTSEGGKAYAVRLRHTMAEVTASLLEHFSDEPRHLLIEGGATAYAILCQMPWRVFQVEKEWAPGVVTLSHGEAYITMKPGSYQWS